MTFAGSRRRWVDDGARWVGNGSAALGLAGSVDPSELSAALAARHPSTGRPLVLRHRSVVALDLTFAAPKSVSLLFGLGPPGAAEHAVDAHRSAVDAALEHLQRRAWVARRGTDDGRVPVATDGLIGAAFTHCLSRAGDPHLHTHVVAANLAHGEDGRWSALDSRGPFAHARAAGALYQAHLRAELSERLGLGWAWSEGRGWDVAGVEPSTRAAFSGRAAEIREHLAARGLRSAGAAPGRLGRHAARPRSGEERRGDARRMARQAARGPRMRARAQRRPLDAPRRVPLRGLDGVVPGGRRVPTRRRHRVVDALATGARGPDVEASVEHWAPVSRNSIGVGEPRVVPCRLRTGTTSAGPARLAAGRARRATDLATGGGGDRSVPGASGPVGSGLDCQRAEMARMPRAQLADHLELSRSVRDALGVPRSRRTGPARARGARARAR